jgi:hypothetical protein
MKIGNTMNKQIHLKVGLKIDDKLFKHWDKYIHPKAWVPIHRCIWRPILDITYPTLINNNITLYSRYNLPNIN